MIVLIGLAIVVAGYLPGAKPALQEQDVETHEWQRNKRNNKWIGSFIGNGESIQETKQIGYSKWIGRY